MIQKGYAESFEIFFFLLYCRPRSGAAVNLKKGKISKIPAQRFCISKFAQKSNENQEFFSFSDIFCAKLAC